MAFLVVLLTGTLAGSPRAGAVPAPSPVLVDSVSVEWIADAFRAGDAEALLSAAADRIDVVIFGRGASYSRAQALLVISDFFRRYPPQRVAFEQEVLAENRRSMIGTYWVDEEGAEPVAVFVRLRARDDDWQLRSIRIGRGTGRQ